MSLSIMFCRKVFLIEPRLYLKEYFFTTSSQDAPSLTHELLCNRQNYPLRLAKERSLY